ncbi:MAG: DUF2199 domain-containing protein [Phycisphaerales bacterium]|nr:DUF2199 domain-containing protein [Phycisphaerales bacterium]
MSEISLGADAPGQWSILTDAERAASILTPDQCMIEADGKSAWFIRGCLSVPIQHTDEEFTWGVWCSLSAKSHDEISQHWDDPERIHLGPHFGWLSTAIPHYPDTMFMKTMVHHQAPGLRPLIILEPTDHPLSVDQREGISSKRMKAIVESAFHDFDE